MPRLTEPDARTASVLVDELDAGGLQYFSDFGDGFLVSAVTANFNVRDRVSVRTGSLCEISHSPIQSCTVWTDTKS
jgi:hypothetical protein